MNPLNRRMFRQPGASRRATGILASSPQLANTVANRQPVRMSNGGTNTYTAAVQRAVEAGDKRALQELAKPVNYGAAARTPDGQNALRLARQALAQSTRISTDTAVDTPISDAERMAANRSNLAALRAAQGLGQGADLSMPKNIADPDPVIDARKNLAALRAAQGLDQGATVPATTDDAPSILDRGIAAAKSAVTGDFMRPLTDAIVKGVKDDASSIASVFNADTRMSPANVAARSRIPMMDDNPPDATGNVFKEMQEAKAKAIADADMGQTPLPFGDEFGNIAPDGSMPGETLVTSTTTPTTTDDSKKTEVVTPSETDIAIQKVSDNALNFKGDVFNQKDKKKLTAKEATNQSVLENFSYETADFISPEEVDLKAIDKAAEDLMGFDPKAAGEKRENAFWMGLMKAGLAIAAGGSENAITNIAKGLSFGLDSYGKDIATLNEQEREDRKEFRRLKVKMIDDQRAYNLSMAGAMNTHNQHIADARNKFNMNRRTLGLQEAQNELSAARLKADNAYRVAVMQNTAIVDAARLRQKDKEIELSEKTLQATVDKLTPKNLRTFQQLGLVKDGKFTEKALELYTTEANAVRALLDTGTSQTGPKVQQKERFVADGMKNQYLRDGAESTLAKKGIKNPTEQQIAAEISSLYDSIIAGTIAPAAPATQNKPTDGFGEMTTTN